MTGPRQTDAASAESASAEQSSGTPVPSLPYKIAVLCYLYDSDGRLLLLHRTQRPNAGMFSPIGGKLHMDEGEGPHDCARREIGEETGIDLDPAHIRLCGIVTEKAYEGETHWLMYLFEVMRPIDPAELAWTEFNEGTLDWIPIDEVERLDIPETDRKVMWPLIKSHRSGFFVAHIDCSVEPMEWTVHEQTEG